MSKPFHYGGQAVIEGVMMRGQKYMAIAVRRPNGDPLLHSEPLSDILTGNVIKMPFVRGVIVLGETLLLGIRSLLFSANVTLEEEKQEITPKMAWGMLAVALAFAVGVFFVLPLLIIQAIDPFIGSSLVSNLVEGAIRLGMLLAYLWAVTFMPDIRRVFAYHGAEHKTINAYEAGEPLEVDRVRKYSTAHPRCGTAFLLFVMIVAVLVFILLGRPPMVLRVFSRIALIPFIASISYELIRFSANHMKNRLAAAIFYPSLALQGLTTREPDDSQIEIAIHALKEVLRVDGVVGAAGAKEGVGLQEAAPEAAAGE